MDAATIAIIDVISGLIGALLMSASSLGRRPAGTAEDRLPFVFWAAGIACYTLGHLLLIVQPRLPAWLGVVAANCLILSGWMVLVRGLRLFAGRSPGGRARLAAMALFGLALAVFTWSFPSLQARVILVSSALAAVNLEAAWLCFRSGSGSGAAIHRMTAFFFAVFALGFAARGVALALHPVSSIFVPTAVNLLTFAVTHFGIIGTSLGLILMQNRRLGDRLAASEERHRGIVEGARDGIFQATWDGRIVAANPSFARLLGYSSPEELIASAPDAFDFLADPAERRRFIGLRRAAGHLQGEEVQVVGRDGERRWLVASAVAESASPGGADFTATVVDISGRHAMEEELRAADEEKAVLLRELQHRVKNSLGLIVHLVHLESDRLRRREALSPADCADSLGNIEGRVMALVSLYDLLLRSSSERAVDLGAYLRDIAAGLMESSGAERRGIALLTGLERMDVEFRRALPLGLIANELVTDSLKHAFVGRDSGTIRLALRPAAGGRAVLEISDDGVGLPPGVMVEGGGGLGMTLVRALVAQVDGRLVSGPGPGTSFLVDFPLG